MRLAVFMLYIKEQNEQALWQLLLLRQLNVIVFHLSI